MNKLYLSLMIVLISLCSQGCLYDECDFDSDCNPDDNETATCDANICVYKKKPVKKCYNARDCGVGHTCVANECH